MTYSKSPGEAEPRPRARTQNHREVTVSKMKRKSQVLLIILLTAVICLCGYQLWKMSERYVKEEQIKKKLASYLPPDIKTISSPAEKPEENPTEDSIETEEELPEPQVNRFIVNLQNEVNKDIAGWITVPGTNIDYPFVKAADNNYYLRRDVFGSYALAGTVFMDYRCAADFTGFNTIIYGHNMKNNSMFGDLCLFEDEWFFEAVRFGTIFLKDKTYTLEFFAFMIVREDDNIIYDPYATAEDSDKFFEYVKACARNYREPDREKRAVTLSTCSNDGSVRVVLIANIT